MLFPLFSLLPLAASTLIPSPPQHILSNPALHETTFKIPTTYESAVQARRVLNLTPIGTLSTVFPSPSTLEQRPDGLAGVPIGLMDYFADCESSGDPTVLAVNIATSFKNVAAGSNISLSVQWTPPYPSKGWIGSFGSKKALPYSSANLPRFALLGYLEKIEDEEVQAKGLQKCFTKVHPDSKWWQPGNPIHESGWVRLVVQNVYWIGGFGDRAYIGWIPIDEWRNVTRKEWQDITLPGEKKGLKEWAVDTMGQWEL
ncbi:hypothetical protein LCER1_G005413 [Lachnellula cervina]|uniref:CREG-like beta-barrel domain-containing protein n=1 Tax=Lachnellula cervina TaxID=1316786 RepID=A0A7D8UMR4_9HELO|nr:hypothetical protein LCER1_G005413 [Lachnellula cervina]